MQLEVPKPRVSSSPPRGAKPTALNGSRSRRPRVALAPGAESRSAGRVGEMGCHRRLRVVILDMHVHTTVGSYDSNLSPLDLIHRGKAAGLDGVVVTEHDRGWDRDLARQLTREHDFLILCGMEVSTELGHILVYGLEEYVSGILYANTLRQVVDKIDAVMFWRIPTARPSSTLMVAGMPEAHADGARGCRPEPRPGRDGLKSITGPPEIARTWPLRSESM